MPSDWSGVATLVDPTRRAVYEHVRTVRRPVTREETATGLGISRNLATFHLDKLVDAGLLEVTTGTRAHRRGRTPKMYRPSGTELALTVPQRRYELIGQILADAVADDPARAHDRAVELAHRYGRELARASAGGHDPVDLLDGLGFEPERRTEETVLHNCPFHELARRQRELVCGLNLAFVRGLLDGWGASDVDAVLAPRPQACCVVLRPGRPAASG